MSDPKTDSVVVDPPFACDVVTYLTWGDGDGRVRVECDGGPSGDCGYSEDVTDRFGVTVQDMTKLAIEHRRTSIEKASNA